MEVWSPIWGSPGRRRLDQGCSSRPSLWCNVSQPSYTCNFIFAIIGISFWISQNGSLAWKDPTCQTPLMCCKTMLSHHLRRLSWISGLTAARNQNYDTLQTRYLYLLLYLCLCLYREFYLRPWDTQWMIIYRPARGLLTSATLFPNCLSEIVFLIWIFTWFFTSSMMWKVSGHKDWPPSVMEALRYLQFWHLMASLWLLLLWALSYRVEKGHVGSSHHRVAHPCKEGHDCNLKRRGQEQYEVKGGNPTTPKLCSLYFSIVVLW